MWPSLDLRTSPYDNLQRMLNVLTASAIPIHRRSGMSSTCVMLNGSITEIFYDNEGNEIARYHLVAGGQNRGVQISARQ